MRTLAAMETRCRLRRRSWSTRSTTVSCSLEPAACGADRPTAAIGARVMPSAPSSTARATGIPCNGDALIRSMAALALSPNTEVIYVGTYGAASEWRQLAGSYSERDDQYFFQHCAGVAGSDAQSGRQQLLCAECLQLRHFQHHNRHARSHRQHGVRDCCRH